MAGEFASLAGADALIIRHPASGAAQLLADWTGDGGVPAQGAADAVTASLITARPEETP